ncbi:MAG: DUF393 domain-containing protein [Pseudomonadota bacterium]
MTERSAAQEVFYDGACPVCRAEINQYKGMVEPGSVTWTNVAEDGGLPEGYDRATLLARFHTRREDGKIVSGARAFLAVWRQMPRLRWAGRALDRQPFIAVLDLLYSGFLKIRPLWRKAA